MPRPRTSDRTITIRVPEHEAEILAAHARAAKRTRTDILREVIRSFAPAKTRRRKGKTT